MKTEPTETREQAIRAREQAATKGPWTFRVVKRGEAHDGSLMIGAVAPGHQIRATPPGGSYPSRDGEFIAHAREDIPYLLAQLDALRAQIPQWQPMETAPKDGTWFLAWDYDGGFYVFRDGPGFIASENPQPTHWMPLPSPPKADPERA